MGEKENNLIEFPKTCEDILDMIETRLVLGTIDNPDFQKYKTFLNEKFKGTNGTYSLIQEVDDVEISFKFNIK